MQNNTSGTIYPYAGETAPAGYLLCDGTSYLRADYPALFSAIGVLHGSADGTHFNVPNIKGRAIMGYDSADSAFDTVGKTGGSKTANLAHTHTPNAHTHAVSIVSSGPSGSSQASNDVTTNFSDNVHTHTVSITLGNQSASGSDSQLSSTQSILNPYLTLNLIIKI